MAHPTRLFTNSQPQASRALVVCVGAALGLLYSMAAAAQPASKSVQAPVSVASLAVASATESVAKVALVVGDAVRILPSGQRLPLRLGSELLEQDRVSTGKDALVMLVFSDQGRMALRPETELIIRSYHVDPSGADTKLDFELVRGTVRQISGQGAKLQPERYRLNTPIAAIGVRGTDFLARVDQNKVQTYVHEGSIVLLPPSSDCGAYRGTCDIWAAVNASDAGQYVVVSAAGQVVRSVATPDEVTRLFGIKIADSSTSGAKAGASSRQSASVTSASLSTTPELSRLEGRELLPAITQPAVVPPVGAALPELPSQLVWGRFSNPLALPLTLPVSYDEARAGRNVTVGQFGQYALWRDNPAGQLDTSLRGQAEFALTKSEAFYTTGSQSLPVQIDRATLSVNFDQATFATQLGLSGAAIPAATLSVSGKMNDEGIFTGTNAQGQRVAGALSHNAAEAGYFFTAPGASSSAQYEGLTLWRSK